MCTHTCLLYSFSSCSFWDTLLLLSSCRREGIHPDLPAVRGLLGIRLPVDVPVAPSFREFSYMYLCFRCIRHFVIHVINNIRTRFIISFTWYVLWHTIHSIIYTCDLILARIWLLGLCPVINRVLQLASSDALPQNGLTCTMFTNPDLSSKPSLPWSLFSPVGMWLLVTP